LKISIIPPNDNTPFLGIFLVKKNLSFYYNRFGIFIILFDNLFLMVQRFCTQCGNALKENAQFCGNCGNKAQITNQVADPVYQPNRAQSLLQSTPSEKKSKLPAKKIAAIIVIILIIICGGIFFALPKLGIRAFSSTHTQSGSAQTGTIPANLSNTQKYSFGSIRDISNGYALTMDPVMVNNDITLEKSMTYSKQVDGKYEGTLTLHFTNSGNSGLMQYQESIPKSFASDIKSLSFSVPPDRIIRSDPVVAWNKNVKGSMDIIVTSSEKKSGDDARFAADDILINSSLSECGKLAEPRDQFVCALETTRKYRDSPALKKYLSDLDLSQGTNAAVSAVANRNPDKTCGRLMDEQEALACRKAAFMMYVRDCNDGPAESRPDCIRKNLWQINNYHTIIGACEFITDPALKAECSGSVDAGYCGKITNPDLHNKCLVHAAHKKADVSLCTGVSDTILRDLCTEQVSLAKNDQSVCNGIKDAEQRNSCIGQIAANKGDIHICDTITDPESKSACVLAAGFSATMSGKTEHFQDLSICNTDEMKTNKELHDLCIGMVAAHTVNPDLCEQIEDESSRDTCFLALSLLGDTSVCTRIADDYERDSCVEIIAEGTRDSSLCDDIQLDELKAECKNNTKHGVAAVQVLKPEQVAEVTKTARGGSTNPAGSVCSSPAFKLAMKFTTADADAASGDTDHCYQAIAVNLGDLSMCNNIQRGAPMTKCYMMIAANKGDSSICHQIPDTPDPQAYLTADCLMEVARKTRDPAVCAELKKVSINRMFIGEISQQSCLQQLANDRIAPGGNTI